VLAYQKARIDGQVAALNPSYTNALQLKARIEILQEQNHLKFAALDCWKVMSELLPEDVTLVQFSFQSGKTLNLQGTALAEAQKKVTDFNSDLRKATENGRSLFGEVGPPSISLTPGQGGEQLVRWSFSSELKRTATP
jgi:hypothetical protein